MLTYILQQEEFDSENLSPEASLLRKAAIDIGFLHTKILYRPQGSQKLLGITFKNEHLLEVIQYIKDEADVQKSDSIPVTGTQMKGYIVQIKDILGCDIAVIDKKRTVGYGTFLLANHCKKEDFIFPSVDYKKWVIESLMYDFLNQKIKEKSETLEDNSTSLVLHIGSSCCLMSVDRSGKTSEIKEFVWSMSSFLGFAHVLIGTANYMEIMELAEKGNSTNLDTTVKDLINDDPECPYGNFPPEMSIVPFGKLSEISWDRKSKSVEDTANALVRLVVTDVTTSVFLTICGTGITKLYLTGSFFQHELTRKIFCECILRMIRIPEFEMMALKTEHASVVSLMCLDVKDKK